MVVAARTVRSARIRYGHPVTAIESVLPEGDRKGGSEGAKGPPTHREDRNGCGEKTAVCIRELMLASGRTFFRVPRRNRHCDVGSVHGCDGRRCSAVFGRGVPNQHGVVPELFNVPIGREGY